MMPGIAHANELSIGMKLLPCKPDLAHQPIHQERRARHVAGVFQQADEQEQQQDLRQKHDHRADARDDAVDEQVAQIARRQDAFHHVAQPADRPTRASPSAASAKREDALEDQRHEPHEDQRAPHPVRQHAIQPVAERLAASAGISGSRPI